MLLISFCSISWPRFEPESFVSEYHYVTTNLLGACRSQFNYVRTNLLEAYPGSTNPVVDAYLAGFASQLAEEQESVG